MPALLLLFASLLGQEEPAPAREKPVEIVGGPYLQNVTPTSAVLILRTGEESTWRATLLQDGKAIRESWSEGTRIHVLEWKDLSPGTTYSYRMESGDRRQEGTITTFPADATSEFLFAAYGDGRTQDKVHAEICRAIAREHPLFVLHSGDLVENGTSHKQWNTFFETASELLQAAPLYPALGNHERDAPEYFDLFRLPGNERWYSFDAGPVHFIVLDSNTRYRANEEQKAWLKKDLAESRSPFKIAVYHHPAFSSSIVKVRQRESDLMYRAWGALFEEGGLRLAIQGHNHNYQRAEKNGVTYVTSGGGGAPLYPVVAPLPETKAHKVDHHFLRFRVSPDRISAEAVGRDGTVFDAFALDRPR